MVKELKSYSVQILVFVGRIPHRSLALLYQYTLYLCF